ncbi:MAG: phosphotransferase [Fibromonadaceae bacterium]|jgi:maltose alpha-D-glucosyltransferase/alpha-amylase|nr:phosphotransferase [Fibromonadaceae bacterium]
MKTLMAYVKKARWFMAKDRKLAKLTIRKNIPINSQCSLQFLDVSYSDGSEDLYTYPLGTLAFATFMVSPWLTPRKKPREITGGSNSAFLFPGECFLKLYRRLQSGTHPENEMGIFLRKKKFPYIAAVLGSWKYKDAQGEYTIATVQQALRPGLNAWDLLGEKPNAKKAALLGKRLAQMHLTLGKGREAAFVPEPFTSLYRKQQNQNCLNLANHVQKQLQHALPRLSKKNQQLAQQVLSTLPLLPQKIRRLRASTDTGMRTRIHGDLHLGQIQWNSPEFFFMDFEGEPTRSLAFRREKHSPLRDVAGILRSFAYADAHFKGRRPDLATPFLEAYWQEMGNSLLLPAKEKSRKALLSSYILEKALYEISYELGSRPAWLHVPILGLLNYEN